MNQRTAVQTEKAVIPPLTSVSGGILQRKCACGQHTIGGGECVECSKNRLRGLQTKLALSQPGDPYEQEADRIADQVMRISATPPSAAHSVYPTSPSIRRKPTRQGAEQAGLPLVNDVISSSGQPLDSATRAFFEPRFGHDFSQVRVHADDRAAESAGAVRARAYTVGDHVVFGAKQFSPGSTEGRRLLAHELTHVIQQGGADFTLVPEDDSEDSTLQRVETLSAGAPREISRQVTPKLTSGLMLQRADCPCCADSIAISNITRIDTAAQMGHSFDVDIGLSYPASGPSGSCTLEWWEKTNIPALPGHPPNTWTNLFPLFPTNVAFADWNRRQEVCASSSAPIALHDPPALGKRPGRTVTRTLQWRIVVNSMPPRSDSGCGSATQQVTATQVLTMVSGAPDWAKSSFTTP